MDWIRVLWDWDKWRTLVNTLINIPISMRSKNELMSYWLLQTFSGPLRYLQLYKTGNVRRA